MNPSHLDHVNLAIPDEGVDDAVAFYRDTLGFELEDLDAYRAGDRPIFSIRLSATSLIHVRPIDDFEAPDETNFDHVAVVVEESIDEIEQQLTNAGVEIERGPRELKGATGTAPAVYVRDPFGYRVEIKSAG